MFHCILRSFDSLVETSDETDAITKLEQEWLYSASAVCVYSSVTHSLCGVSNLCASCLCAMHPRQINIYIYIFLGGEDGLFMLEIADAGAHRLGGKKVGHIEEGKGHSRLPWTWVVHVYMILVDQAGCAVCLDKRVV